MLGVRECEPAARLGEARAARRLHVAVERAQEEVLSAEGRHRLAEALLEHAGERERQIRLLALVIGVFHLDARLAASRRELRARKAAHERAVALEAQRGVVGASGRAEPQDHGEQREADGGPHAGASIPERAARERETQMRRAKA